MTREDALKLIQEKVKTKNLSKHMIAVEAIMKALAKRLGGDESAWGMAGLLHDLDYDLTVNDFVNHGKLSAKWLSGLVSDDIVSAIREHAGHEDRKSSMSKALYCADPLSGLITAAALIKSEKKLACVDVEFVLKRFGEQRFAAGASRNQIKTCVELGLSVEEFIEIGLSSMQSVSCELGL